jgi:flagellar hook assembly protein FlgD
VLSDRWRAAGPVVLRWDGRGPDGRRAPAGVYLVRVVAGGRSTTRRVALVP